MKKLVALAILLLSIPSFADEAESPEAFFEKYARLGFEFDPSVANLYSDKAVIRAYRRYPHGLERQMEVPGVQWKALIPRIMPTAKTQNDRSTYTNITISPTSSGYKIKADRYSERSCYTDNGYYLVVEKNESNDFVIIEEYLETQAGRSCPSDA